MTETPRLDPSVAAFDADIETSDGYLYTDNRRLSTTLASATLGRLVRAAAKMEGASVIDIGCGDGFFTVQYADECRPASMLGLDAAQQAVAAAARRAGDRDIGFEVGNMHQLPHADRSFDLALLQGVLHHDDNPARAIAEALRVAHRLVILEPNGYNLGLKVIEKTSTYHRAHRERSYRSGLLRRWVEQAGGRVTSQHFGGFVPMFCPDPLARAMKFLEPAVEATPLRALLAAVVVISATH